MVFTQTNAELLNETARRINVGELTGFESMGAVLALVGLVQAVEEALPELTPPKMLETPWDSTVAVHEQLKDIIRRWLDKEIDSSVVMEELAPTLADIDSVIRGAEESLAGEYHFDPDLLTKQRQEIVDSVHEAFESQ